MAARSIARAAKAHTPSPQKHRHKKVTGHQRLVYREIFNRIDADGSGGLDAGELLEVGKILGVDMSRAEADDMLRAVDADGNGRIDLDEFRAALAARESDAQAAQPDAAVERAVDMSASLESMLGG